MQKIFSRVVIKDENQKILIIQDTAMKWYLPGGKMEKNETPMECAIREIKEEINIDIQQLTELVQGDFSFYQTNWKGYFYFAEYAKGVPVVNEPDKILKVDFISNLTEVDFSEELAEVLIEIDKLISDKITLWN